MSDEKPTREQLAAARAHDPNTCTEGCRHEAHGDQAYDADERKIARLEAELAGQTSMANAYMRERNAYRAELEALRAVINTPELNDFIEGVKREAVHQRERWAKDDVAKTDPDWFWALGYLAGKALHKPEKRLHHLVTAAAILFNWHDYTRAKAREP